MLRGQDENQIYGAMKASPQWSCAQGNLSTWRLVFLYGLGLTVFICFAAAPGLTFDIAMGIVTTIIIFAALIRWVACLSPEPKARPIPDDFDWPKYTVLVPLHNEARVVAGLMSALSRIDYPKDKLQILMICEADDFSTIRAVEHNMTPQFDIVGVLPSLPRTKPKAMNVAMQRATGDIVTIYDAEDRPHPQQLKQAALALHKNQNLGAVQAPLDYYNDNQNWLTRQFTIEYAALFHVMNPFYAKTGLPFPLGGTSNHMRRAALDDCGLWDPHNVTEDADLSFRLSAFGWRIGMITGGTREEAVSEYRNWKAQRERWLKGFMQSYAVHMRRPLYGPWQRGFTLQITLGLTLAAAFLHVPAISILLIAGIFKIFTGTFGDINIWFWAVFLFGYSGAYASNFVGIFRAKQKPLWGDVLFAPLYWVLMFPAALGALHQYITAPFHWNKTRHGDAQDYLKKTNQAHL